MNDTERELKELLERKASEARISPTAPPAVLKRGRRRQLGTVFIAATTTVVVVAASILGVQGLLRGDRTTQEPEGTQPVATRSVLVDGLTISSPSDWTLINEWPQTIAHAIYTLQPGSNLVINCTLPPGRKPPSACPRRTASHPEGLPVIQLSNFDPGLDRSVCGANLPADGAALYIALDVDASFGNAPAYPRSLDLASAPQAGPCGVGTYASFASGGYTYLAFASVGADASGADRRQILDTYDGLSPNGASLSICQAKTPGYVLAGGKDTRGRPWRIEIRPNPDRSSSLPFDMSLLTDDGHGTFSVAVGPTAKDQIQYLNGGGSGIWFGAVPADTTSLEFEPSDGSKPIQATLLDLPPTLHANALGFYVMVPPNVQGQLSGKTPNSFFGVGQAVAAPTPVAGPPGANTPGGGPQIAHGSGLGVGWVATWEPATHKVRFSLLPTATTAHNFSVTVTPGKQIDVAATPTPQGAFVVVAAPAAAGAISVRGSDGTVVHGQSYPGLKEIGKAVVLWVIPLPGSGEGTLESSSRGIVTSLTWQPAIPAGG